MYIPIYIISYISFYDSTTQLYLYESDDLKVKPKYKLLKELCNTLLLCG